VNFEVGVWSFFQARHHLVGNFGPASEEHSHTYRVNVVVGGNRLQSDGTLIDITVVTAALRDVVADLHLRDLNELPALASPNPTVEVVARYIFERVAPAFLARGLDSLSVRVHESDDVYATYAGPLP
jgi:6-pyruvoyltetrahydropterin/6-carboxytetrahydropterin synthase